MKMKLSTLIGFLVIILCITCLSACGNNPAEEQNSKDTQTEQSQTVSDTSETQNDNPANGIIEKFIGAADETGIYTTIITLSDKAADKGVVEMIYCGVTGSPQENSVVNTFRIEYCKKDTGTFEIHTFFDGEVYQNLDDQAKVKVNNTFGATVRAGNVTVYYTPDGGEKTEIYKADAESFINN